jgi:hypothetical protein
VQALGLLEDGLGLPAHRVGLARHLSAVEDSSSADEALRCVIWST